VPRLTFAGERLAEVDLHPISMGFGEPLDRRGTPRLAHGEEAARWGACGSPEAAESFRGGRAGRQRS
jgi:hypothetical protein